MIIQVQKDSHGYNFLGVEHSVTYITPHYM